VTRLAVVSLLLLAGWQAPIWLKPRATIARVSALLIASLAFIFISSQPTIRLADNLAKSLPRYDPKQPFPSQLFDLVKAEHQKAVDEIKMRIQDEDDWFHKKFILVGGLMSAFLIFIGVGERTSADGHGEKQLYRIVTSSAAVSALALSSIISLAIDMHIRSNIVVIQQLGLWIRHCIEQVLAPPPSLLAGGTFLAWESFLRINPPAAGMHSDSIYNFSFYPHLHFLTWFLYVVYLALLQNVSLETRARADQRRLTISLFVLVQLSIAAFAWSAHLYPQAIELKPLPFLNMWLSGWAGAAVYCSPIALMTIAMIPYLRLLPAER
jgi:hypothetical protein